MACHTGDGAAAAVSTQDAGTERPSIAPAALAENLIQAGSSIVTGNLLAMIQDTTQPFIRAGLLFTCILIWIRLDAFLRSTLDRLPDIFVHWANVWKRVSNFIFLTLLYILISYTIIVINISWNAGHLDNRETVVGIAILMIFGFTIIQFYRISPDDYKIFPAGTSAPFPPPPVHPTDSDQGNTESPFTRHAATPIIHPSNVF